MIETTVYLTIKKDGSEGVYHYGGGTPDIITLIDDLIGTAKGRKQEVFVHFLGLSKCALIIANVLYRMGYTPVVGKNKNEMHVGEYRYRITKDTAYYIQVKAGYKSFITMQAVESVIGLRQPPETDDEAKKDIELYKYVRASFLAGKKRSENRILYSSASISRTLFNALNPDFCKAVGAVAKVHLKDKVYNKGEFLERYNRPGTHGGMCFVSEKGYSYRGAGIVLDVNSLYDYIATHYDMPSPRLLRGGYGTMPKRYLNRKLYYTVQKVEVTATLKTTGIACISADSTQGSAYLTSMEMRVLTLNQSDRDLLFDNYSISYYRIKSYLVFATGNDAFRKYIVPLYEKKRTLKKGIERDYIKMCLVGFIGTFARKIQKQDYILYTTEDGTLYGARTPKAADEYAKALSKSDGLVYINNAIVAGARHYIISWIKKYPGRFLYTDTDSIHLSGSDVPSDIPISDKMGDFKVEHTFTDCVYHGQKAYAYIENGDIVPTIAGTPKDTPFTDINDIFTKPYNIKLITEDIKNLEVLYKEEPRTFVKPDDKTAEERKRERDFEWYDNNVVLPEMLKGKKMPGIINRWNFYESRTSDCKIESAANYVAQMTNKETYVLDIAALVAKEWPENYRKYKADYEKVHKTFTVAS